MERRVANFARSDEGVAFLHRHSFVGEEKDWKKGYHVTPRRDAGPFEIFI